MRMIIVHHKDAKEPIVVPECDLPSFAEKGWHPADNVETLVFDPIDFVDSEEIV